MSSLHNQPPSSNRSIPVLPGIITLPSLYYPAERVTNSDTSSQLLAERIQPSHPLWPHMITSNMDLLDQKINLRREEVYIDIASLEEKIAELAGRLEELNLFTELINGRVFELESMEGRALRYNATSPVSQGPHNNTEDLRPGSEPRGLLTRLLHKKSFLAREK